MASGRPRGRPAKHRKRTDGELKATSGVETGTTNAGCIIYTIGLQIPKRQHKSALAHARRRPHTRQALSRDVVAVDSRPRSFSAAERWVHESISKSSDTKNFKRKHPLVLSTTIFNGRQISADCLQVALHWARFWAAGALETRFSRGKGFSLHAVKQLHAGQVVARGRVERSYDEQSYDLKVKGGATLLGPAALANTACSNECTNAEFHTTSTTEWKLEMKHGIAIGKEVLVHYPMANGKCPTCGFEGSWG